MGDSRNTSDAPRIVGHVDEVTSYQAVCDDEHGILGGPWHSALYRHSADARRALLAHNDHHHYGRTR